MNLTVLPNSIIAGDGYTIDLTYEYKPSDGYSAVMYLRGSQVLAVDATVIGDSFRFALTSSITRNLSEGIYEVAVAVKKNDERTTVQTAWLEVKADFASAGNRVSHAERVLAAIEDAIAGRVTDDVESLSIAGRSISLIPIMELLQLRAIYTKEVNALKGRSSYQTKTVRLKCRGVN